MPKQLLALAVIGILNATCLAQSPADLVKERYTKYEYRVPMRDGVKLFTIVWLPKDDSQTYPIMLHRTPYGVGPYGADRYSAGIGPSIQFEKVGYIFVHQDVRGRLKSEGKFVHVRPLLEKRNGAADTDESTDTFDTIDWLIKNVRGNNGKVGQWGISYPGFYVNCGMVEAHPALKAVSPQGPVTDLFDGDDVRHNGALQLAHNFGFMNFFHKMRPEMYRQRKIFDFDHGTPDGYEFFLNLGPLKNADSRYLKGNEPFWNEILAHEAYDEYGKSRDVRRHMRNIKPAVMTVGGWFDAEDLAGTLATFRQIEATGAPAAGNHLIMGPWQHGGWTLPAGDRLGDVAFQLKTSEHYREQIELPFFEYHLKGKGTLNHPKAWVFETGVNRWRRFAAWPPEGTIQSLILGDGGRLEMKEGLEPADKGGFDEFVSDPAKPVPFINKVTTGMPAEYMTADQRFAASRTDVLVYQTPKLENDVTFAGPIEVDLFVSTTGTDADWVVKVIDVYPGDFPNPDPNPTNVKLGSYQQLVRGDVFRGKFRNSREKPEPFKPGEITRIKFKLSDVLHTFRPGHRIMIHIQSSWFPLIDRNPQTFCDIGKANESDFRKATHRVYRDADRTSRISVRVVK
jgi:putative CocE/NonD family hydrolase